MAAAEKIVAIKNDLRARTKGAFEIFSCKSTSQTYCDAGAGQDDKNIGTTGQDDRKRVD